MSDCAIWNILKWRPGYILNLIAKLQELSSLAQTVASKGSGVNRRKTVAVSRV